jgi:hypothetical protein
MLNKSKLRTKKVTDEKQIRSEELEKEGEQRSGGGGRVGMVRRRLVSRFGQGQLVEA